MSVPRCAARRRDGCQCGALATPTATYCRHHEQLVAELGKEAVKSGTYPRRRSPREETPLVVEPVPVVETVPVTNGTAISPAEVRPRLAQITADSVVEIQHALLDAALGATRESWTTFTCPDCGKRHRAQVEVPDVRARVGAIEVLLREGLGRPAQAEEVTTPPFPENVEAIRTMGWEEMQQLFAAIYVDEIAAVQRDGGDAVVRAKLGSLSEEQRCVLREALDAVR
jgi:hypothetical protein